MVKNIHRNQKKIYLVTGYWLLVTLFLSGCGPTYPKDKIREGIVNLCKKEYKVDVDSRVMGNTVAVYLPVETLFDAVLNLDTNATKKINDVILGVSRVALSTDAKFDFYVVIAQDPKVPEIEIVYIRYVDDVKRFLLGAISRGDYAKRAVIALKTPPQAERERILKELFSKLKIEGSDEMIKEYLESEGSVAGIGEISYWDKKFFIKEIGLPEFLIAQLEERIKMEFKQDNDLNKWYEFKTSEGKFVKEGDGNIFIFNLNVASRVAPLYLDSGIELDGQQKDRAVFKKLLGIVGEILWAYKFSDFNEIEFSLPTQKLRIGKNQLWEFKDKKLKIEDLV